MNTVVRTLVSLVVFAGSALFAVPASAAAAAPASAAIEVSDAVDAVSGDADDFTFSRMDADYTLGRDDDGASTLKVVETFVAQFPDADQNHGLRRSIPSSYNGQPLHPTLVSVTDGDGNRRPAEVDSEDGTFSITSRDKDFLHGTQTFVFTYTLQHVTWTFADSDDDEFYWDVNGVDWPQPFDKVTATLHLPADLADALTGEKACYRGQQGATGQQCGIQETSGSDGTEAISVQADDLAPHETLTMAVGFTEGTFTPFNTSFFSSTFGWLQLAAAVGALAALTVAIATRLRRMKDAPGRPTIIAEYDPPQQIDAMQSAVLLGRRQKAIPAEILEQAVVGSLRLVEGEKRMFGARKMQAELLDRSKADEDGQMLLDGLFGAHTAPGALFTFGRSNTRFSKAAQKMLAWADRNLTRRGMRRVVPGRVRALPITLGALFMAGVILLGVLALSSYVSPALPVILIVVAVAAFAGDILLLVHRPLSADGAEVRDHLKGLKMFIEWAEADRIRMLQSPEGAERTPVDANDPRQVLHLYEKLLPYAVVFGQEQQWADRLAVMYDQGYGLTTTPYWYVGVHGFNAAAFTAGIGSLSTAATSSSSTTGGASGGGFAGGGGGGGGGGGV